MFIVDVISCLHDRGFKKRQNALLGFLRGIAIFLVLLVHVKIFLINQGGTFFNMLTSEGARGVQLFYMLSALTLFLSLDLSSYIGERRQVIIYLLRRFFRIAPLFYFIILIYVLLYLLSLHFSYFLPYVSHSIVSFKSLLLSYSFLVSFSPEYMNSVVPGQWSIAIEMIFYALVPILFLRIKST